MKVFLITFLMSSSLFFYSRSYSYCLKYPNSNLSEPIKITVKPNSSYFIDDSTHTFRYCTIDGTQSIKYKLREAHPNRFSLDFGKINNLPVFKDSIEEKKLLLGIEFQTAASVSNYMADLGWELISDHSYGQFNVVERLVFRKGFLKSQIYPQKPYKEELKVEIKKKNSKFHEDD